MRPSGSLATAPTATCWWRGADRNEPTARAARLAVICPSACPRIRPHRHARTGDTAVTTFRPLPHDLDGEEVRPEAAGVDLDRAMRVDEVHVDTLFWMLWLDKPLEHGCEGEITPAELRLLIDPITNLGRRALARHAVSDRCRVASATICCTSMLSRIAVPTG
jgi:hypothetical protein